MQGAGLNIRRDSVVSQHRAAMMVSYFSVQKIFLWSGSLSAPLVRERKLSGEKWVGTGCSQHITTKRKETGGSIGFVVIHRLLNSDPLNSTRSVLGPCPIPHGSRVSL